MGDGEESVIQNAGKQIAGGLPGREKGGVVSGLESAGKAIKGGSGVDQNLGTIKEEGVAKNELPAATAGRVRSKIWKILTSHFNFHINPYVPADQI